MTNKFICCHMSYRSWCFTLHDPTDAEIASISELDVVFIIFQQEECPTTKRRHLQGFVRFKKTNRITGVKKCFGLERIHLEGARGTDADNVKYCSKDDTRVVGTNIITRGKLPGPGCRTDLHRLVSCIKEHEALEHLYDEFPGNMLRYPRGVSDCRSHYMEFRQWKPVVDVYFGEPGTGKTRAAFESNEDSYWIMPPHNDSVWFDGYNGNPSVIIDDFYGWIKWSLLLQMLDRYPLRVQTKGGTTSFLARNIIITSNSHPRDWYTNKLCHYGALRRRIDNVFEFMMVDGELKKLPHLD